MTQRTLNITQCPDRFLKHFLAHGFLTYLSQKHEFQVFIFLLDESGMAQNNSLFVWKTSNYSHRRSNLRNDMNQVTNLQSLGFKKERTAKILGVFPELVLCDIGFCDFFDVAFDPHIFPIPCFVVDRVPKLVLFVPVAEADDTSSPTLRNSLFSPLILENSLPKPCATDGCWFSSISLFVMLNKSINDSTISFGVFLLLITLEECTGNRLSLLS